MIVSAPAKSDSRNSQQAADGELGGVFLAASHGRVWVAAFIAGLISLSIISIAIFPGTDGQRGFADWLLLILFPILVSALLATFVAMFLAPQTNRPADLEADYPVVQRGAAQPKRPDKQGPVSTKGANHPPFMDWLARELSGNEFGSLNVALDTYIQTFDLPRNRRPHEPGEIADYRLKLAILKDNLLAHPQWKDAPELNEYVADLESLLGLFDSAPAAEHGEPSIAR